MEIRKDLIKDIENIIGMNYIFYCDYKGAYKFILFKRLPGERLEKLPPIWIYQNEIYIYSDDPKLNNSILEFIAYRKSIKKPMTENAVKLMLGKLNKMSSDVNEQIDILNQSIVNGWAGIFPLPVEKRQQKKNNFNNYPQRTYNFDDLEKQLLANK